MSADELKGKGNAAFSAGNFQEAIDFFTQAIAVDGNNHVLYSNRSASYASLQEYEKALEDAKKCVATKPDWAKGYSRLGAAFFGLGDFTEAAQAYESGLKLDPANEQLQSGLADAQREASKPQSPFSSPQFIMRMATDPRTKPLLADAEFMGMLTTVQKNPQLMSMYLADKRFQLALEVGLGLKMSTGEEMQDTASAPPKAESNGHAASSSGGSAASKPAPEPAPEPEPMDDEEREKAAKKKEALAEKEKGNAAYKKKEFATAISHYDRALELYNEDISFLTNRAAVHFEMANYEACIADCEAAVERGQALRSDFKLIAKALARKGNALVKLNRLEEAIAVLNKSLMEHRTPDTLAALNKTEKTLKEQREKAYIDMAKCDEARELGNTAFKEQRFPEAVKHYEEALKRGPASVNAEAYKLYSNLAATFTKLGAYPDGKKAAEKCIELQPDFAKGHSRLGTCLYFMKEHDKAMESYARGLELEADNQDCIDGMQRCRQAIGRMASGQATDEEVKERQARAMSDPEVQGILKDPVMQNVLREMQEDPKAAQHHLRAPEIMRKLNKLVGAGIIQLR